MVVIEIKYVNQDAAAFTINGELYYIKIGPDLPAIYDRALRKMIIPNIDLWLQAQTQQRYSYRGLQDMMAAFRSGLQHSYASDDLENICKKVFDETVKAIFTTKAAQLYAKIFKIELMEPKKAIKLIFEIKKQYDKHIELLGEEKLYKYLCRILKFCNLHEPSQAAAVETLIKRLNKAPRDPEPLEINQEEVRNLVIQNIVGIEILPFKGISENIMRNTDMIQTKQIK